VKFLWPTHLLPLVEKAFGRHKDPRAIERRTRPMLGFEDFRCARIIVSGIETMHMIAKGQMKPQNGKLACPPHNCSIRWPHKPSCSTGCVRPTVLIAAKSKIFPHTVHHVADIFPSSICILCDSSYVRSQTL
jgi:hypothetical protein